MSLDKEGFHEAYRDYMKDDKNALPGGGDG